MSPIIIPGTPDSFIDTESPPKTKNGKEGYDSDDSVTLFYKAYSKHKPEIDESDSVARTALIHQELERLKYLRKQRKRKHQASPNKGFATPEKPSISFPLISTTLDGFYQRYPTVPQQNINRRAQPRSQVGPSLPKPRRLTITDARKSRVSKRASGAAGPTRERQLIWPGASFKPKHRPLSLTRIVRRGIWPRSTASRPG